MSEQIWNQSRLELLIAQGVEESINLDYKEARSLDKTPGKKSEITKDVSAMANAAGGVIIFGIAEHQDKDQKHLPEKIDPINRTEFPKEWLEQVIGNIQPKIDGVRIHSIPISFSTTSVVYVVEIPQSHTAHQANDFRYYRRFEFASVPMSDYEIRDVMARRQYPNIDLQFEIVITQERGEPGGISSLYYFPSIGEKPTEPKVVDKYTLEIWALNSGRIFAQYVNAIIEIPNNLLPPETDDEYELDITNDHRETQVIDGVEYFQHFTENTTRDYIGSTVYGSGSTSPNYGPARHVPVLPGRFVALENVELADNYRLFVKDDLEISWEVFADNALPKNGKIKVAEIKIIDKRKKQE